MKQKIEIEIDVPKGYELESFMPDKMNIEKSPLFNSANSWYSAYVSYRLVEPPLELETQAFNNLSEVVMIVRHTNFNTESLNIIRTWNMTPAEARDLAKILNYWAEHGKLPKVTVKEAE